ncbi:MAG: NAD(+) synthase [Deltaproteobacteria bacterium]|nr:MAG: NAD(+) synthase [Deltaproteobacteria bacterium]
MKAERKINLNKLTEEIVDWLKAMVKEAGSRGLVFGMSGGLDSSVVAVLCKKAFPDESLGLFMPCNSAPLDLDDAQRVAEEFQIENKLIELSNILSELYGILEGKPYLGKKGEVPAANLKPRLRMIALYYFANKLNYLVVGTGNRSEMMMGYFTKYGDGGVDILPLGGLTKSEVRQLAEFLGTPTEIINKPPSAGLWEGQTDEGEMGIAYDELDRIIQSVDKGEVPDIPGERIENVKKTIRASEHKRSLPQIFQPVMLKGEK